VDPDVVPTGEVQQVLPLASRRQVQLLELVLVPALVFESLQQVHPAVILDFQLRQQQLF